jgi:hypothetical protein
MPRPIAFGAAISTVVRGSHFHWNVGFVPVISIRGRGRAAAVGGTATPATATPATATATPATATPAIAATAKGTATPATAVTAKGTAATADQQKRGAGTATDARVDGAPGNVHPPISKLQPKQLIRFLELSQTGVGSICIAFKLLDRSHAFGEQRLVVNDVPVARVDVGGMLVGCCWWL